MSRSSVTDSLRRSALLIAVLALSSLGAAAQGPPVKLEILGAQILDSTNCVNPCDGILLVWGRNLGGAAPSVKLFIPPAEQVLNVVAFDPAAQKLEAELPVGTLAVPGTLLLTVSSGPAPGQTDVFDVDFPYIDHLFVGSVAAFAMELPPTGWLECNGQEVSRTSYARLFQRIGTAFGAGDGATTFNLPDLRGQFIRGWAHGSNVDPYRDSREAPAPGGASGDRVGSHQWWLLGSHSHPITDSTGSSHHHSSHQHNVYKASGPAELNPLVPRKEGILLGLVHSNSTPLDTSENEVGQAAGSQDHNHEGIAGWRGREYNDSRPVNTNLMFCIKY